jgi:hypothetical protein
MSETWEERIDRLVRTAPIFTDGAERIRQRLDKRLKEARAGLRCLVCGSAEKSDHAVVNCQNPWHDEDEANMKWSAPQMEKLLGHATWVWDADMGMHIPVCSGWKMNGAQVVRCFNGPLEDPEIDVGLCTEGPHLPTHERSI